MSVVLFNGPGSNYNYNPLEPKEKEPLLLAEEGEVLAPAAPEESVRELVLCIKSC